MPDFLSKVNLAKRYMDNIRHNNAELRRLRDEHRNATLTEQEKKISEELDYYIGQNSELNNKMKIILQEITQDVDESKIRAPEEPETRMKITSQSALSNKFGDILKESQEIQTDMKNSVKEKVTRQVRLIDDTLTPAQIDEISQDPEVICIELNVRAQQMKIGCSTSDSSKDVQRCTYAGAKCSLRHSRQVQRYSETGEECPASLPNVPRSRTSCSSSRRNARQH
eukprot:TRINITY_DN5232_c0_g2_i2.p1 TRINITY_DN5232_c0_g2~~TRINITY_DN5232_c0_g2_i2.p1  ORF type:complete len:225 (-),score=27.88 TRINITY_DN5232_c0_g2_i2:419-1093(-)